LCAFGRLKTAEAKMMALIGDPKADEGFLKEVSPVAQAARIRAPLLLAYGGRDRIVAAEQAEELSAALRREGKQFKLVVFPEEGHALSTRKNRIDFFWEVERFLKEHLK
jgi:dipeptidyl aminopeptidase/acylaminoacyl peptidase